VEIESTVRDLLASCEATVVAAYLFGSVARGTAHPGSDVDIAVLLTKEPSTFDELPLGLEADLERALGLPVQVVVLNTAPPDLVHRVLRDGRLVLDRDRSQRIRFEVRSRNLFFDVEPYIRQYRRLEAGDVEMNRTAQ
jgi:predicted nucleotidyltransferase